VTEPVRVLIADDEDLVRSGLSLMLGSQPGIAVAGEAADGAQAVAEARRLRPDVVLMDIRMPGMDGLQATARITAAAGEPGAGHHPRVIILTTFEQDEYVYEALRAGASGFLLKRTQARGPDRGDTGRGKRGRPARPVGHPTAHRPLRPAPQDRHGPRNPAFATD
jgi:CheY-like chemotaxis protein